MGIISNIKSWVLTSFNKNAAWKEFFNTTIQTVDVEIFNNYQFQGVPLYIKFNQDSVNRGYLTPVLGNPGAYQFNIPITNVKLTATNATF